MAKFRPARFAFEIIDLLIKLGTQIARDKDGGWTRSEVLALVNVAAIEGLDVMEAAGVVFEPETENDEEPSAKVVRATARLGAIHPGLIRSPFPAKPLGVVDTGDLEPVPAPSGD